jgi:uncharacterized membrane protein YgcG
MLAMGSGAISREGGRLSVRTSIPRTVLMAVGSALFVAGGGAICVAWIVTLPEQAAETPILLLVVTRLVTLPLLVVGGLGGVVFFGWALLFFLGRLLFFWRPVLEVGLGGILDGASAVGVGFVPWEEVKDVTPGYFGGQRYIKIEVENEENVLQRQNPAKRLFIRLNRRYFTGTVVNIPLTMLAVSEEELLSEIKPHLSPPARRRLERRSERGSKPESVTASRERFSGATARARQRSPAVRAFQWLWALALSLLFIAAGLALAGGGVIFAAAGVQAVLEPDDAGHAIAGVLFAAIGLAAVVGGILTIWWLLPRGVKKLSGRRPPKPSGSSGASYGGFFGGDGGGSGGDGGGDGGGC